jgi:hypothetical protein
MLKFKLSILSLSLVSTFVFANNVFIQSDNITGLIGDGTVINKINPESLSLDVPSGLKVTAYSDVNFNGEASQYKEGEHTNLKIQSFKVEQDIQTSFSMAFNEYNPDDSYCVDVRYNNKNYENITVATICSGETKEIFTVIPDGFSAGESIPFAVWKDDSFILMGTLDVRSTGEMTLNGKPSVTGGVRAYAQTPSLLNMTYYRK